MSPQGISTLERPRFADNTELTSETNSFDSKPEEQIPDIPGHLADSSELDPYSLVSRAALYIDGKESAVLRGDLIYVLQHLMRGTDTPLYRRDFSNFGNTIESRAQADDALGKAFMLCVRNLSKVIKLTTAGSGPRSTYLLSAEESRRLELKPVENARSTKSRLIKFGRQAVDALSGQSNREQMYHQSQLVQKQILELLAKSPKDSSINDFLVPGATAYDGRRAIQRLMQLPEYASSDILRKRVYTLSQQIKLLEGYDKDVEKVAASPRETKEKSYQKMRVTISKKFSDTLVSIRSHGACNGNLLSRYYPRENESNSVRDIEDCQRCSVIRQCGFYALINNEAAGIWGGMSYKTRDKFNRALGLEDRFFLAQLDEDNPLRLAFSELIEKVASDKQAGRKGMFAASSQFRTDLKNLSVAIKQAMAK